MDLPCSGVYRFGELFRFELPRQFDRYKLLVKGLARFLALKVCGFAAVVFACLYPCPIFLKKLIFQARVRNVLGVLQDIGETSTMEMLEDPDLFWSPKKKPRTQFTRP